MTTRTTQDQRPLSPHLQVYRPQWTSVLSILHRITGVLLSAGTVLIAAWLVALASGADAYAAITGFLARPLVVAVLVAWTLALFYHLLNGIRHLFWDAGMMLELGPARASGIAVVIGAFVLTAVVWLMPLFGGSA
jgi:succinate dehydrogenase / fumarate reductase cytochrome b subunit